MIEQLVEMKLSFKFAGKRGGSKKHARDTHIYILYYIYDELYKFKMLQVCGMWVTCWIGVQRRYST